MTIVLTAVVHEPHWYDLGLELGFLGPALEEIKITNKGDVPECRKYMIMSWLKQSNDIQPSVEPNWQTLCRALRKPLVGNNVLADQIGQAHLRR